MERVWFAITVSEEKFQAHVSGEIGWGFPYSSRRLFRLTQVMLLVHKEVVERAGTDLCDASWNAFYHQHTIIITPMKSKTSMNAIHNG